MKPLTVIVLGVIALAIVTFLVPALLVARAAR